MMHRSIRNALTALAALAIPATLVAQPSTTERPTGFPTAITDVTGPALTGAIPLRAPLRGAPVEQWSRLSADELWLRNVVDPALVPVLPDAAKATGAAVIVAPGGGFRFLSWENEGVRVARYLADHGIAAFILKYRTVPVPRDPPGFMRALGQMMSSIPANRPLDATPEALADAQAAVRLLRSRAGEFGIDPARIGFIGFSAGAITALSVGIAPEKDARPDFIAPIYGGMEARPIPADAPPMFLAMALDDPLFGIGKPLGLIQSWRDAKRPIEVHLYERGGHGFGLANRSAGSALWADEFIAWMKDRKLLSAGK